jgi:hypothetical protein
MTFDHIVMTDVDGCSVDVTTIMAMAVVVPGFDSSCSVEVDHDDHNGRRSALI